MPSHLQRLLLTHFVAVCSQTCYTQCLEDPAGDATNVTIMTSDGSGDPIFSLYRQWVDRKIIEFNELYPAICVTQVHVTREEMVSQVLQDVASGTNRIHAYLMPFMNVHGATSMLADRLMDLSTFTVDNVNDIAWQTIGRFFRAHSSLYQGKVLTLPVTGDFFSLYYREDVFTSSGMTVPRTLEEFVLVSQALNGMDLNGDDEPDYGACLPGGDYYSAEYFFFWIAQTLQYRGTSQGFLFDTDSLTPLLNNSVVQEAIRLWKQVAGPATPEAALASWLSGRCAMTITPSTAFTAVQRSLLHGTIGTAIMPGSEKVWSRDTAQMIVCNKSACRHGTQYPDGLVVNHAPPGQSFLDGAINGQVDRSTQLAAYTFLSWLMNDANMVDAVVDPSFSPSYFVGGFVRPRRLVPSEWTPYGWRDPGLSRYCTTSTGNMEHPNAAIGLRLPNALEYLAAVSEILQSYVLEVDEFADLDEGDSAVLASKRISAALEEVTDRGDRHALVVTYQKSLNIYVAETARGTARRGEVFPRWAIQAVLGMLSGSLCLTLSVFLFWLTSTLRQRQRLRRKQQAAWEEIVEAAEIYSSTLGCPMALVSAADFFDLGCLVKYETLREEGKLRVLDTMEKVGKFQKKNLIIVLSHHWFALNVVDPDGVHYKTMCAAVQEVTKVVKFSMDRVFLWADICSIPQEHLATRELFLAAVPLYVSLADYFLLIAPPTAHDDGLLDLSTHLRSGWCRAELLARLVASGIHRLFLCEDCDGALQQATSEMVGALDLNVFLGDFPCCAAGHVGSVRCDRERLRTPILGIFALFLRDSMRDQEAATDRAGSHGLLNERIERDRERLFPRSYEYVTTCNDLTSSVHVRELFGPLVEMVERRLRASGATSSAVGTSGVDGVPEELRVVTQSGGLSPAPTSCEEGEVLELESIQLLEEEEDALDTDAPCETRCLRGQPTSAVPSTSGSEADASQPEANCPNGESDTGSCVSVEKKGTDVVQCHVHDTDIIVVGEFIRSNWICCGIERHD